MRLLTVTLASWGPRLQIRSGAAASNSRQKRSKMFGVITYHLVNIGSAFSYHIPGQLTPGGMPQ
jgi:hypothetical protein